MKYHIEVEHDPIYDYYYVLLKGRNGFSLTSGYYDTRSEANCTGKRLAKNLGIEFVQKGENYNTEYQNTAFRHVAEREEIL